LVGVVVLFTRVLCARGVTVGNAFVVVTSQLYQPLSSQQRAMAFVVASEMSDAVRMGLAGFSSLARAAEGELAAI
jgi:hypothetical protein